MESVLWRSAIEKGEANVRADTIIRILMHRLGTLEPALRERIRTLSDADLLKNWHDDALFLPDDEAAQRLADRIRKALLP